MADAPNLPATQDQQPAKELSQAEKQRARMDSLVHAVEQRSDQLQILLSQSGIKFERFVEVFRRALIKGAEKPQTNLLLADAGSVIQACIDACTAGVLPDGKKGAIVCYNTNIAPKGKPANYVKRAQFQMMYEGMLEVAYASGNFRSIMATVVYDVDEWDYGLGIDPWVKHKPGPRPPRPTGPPYEVVAAYAVAKTTNGGVFLEVFEPEDIRKVMAVSKATSGPAKDWPEQMARKGPLRRMWKFLPRNERMDRILEVDDGAYDQELLSQHDDAPAKEERKLRPGFAPAKPPAQPALTQGADQVVDLQTQREPDFVDAGFPGDEGYDQMMRQEEPPRASDPAEKRDIPPPAEEPEGDDDTPPAFAAYDAALRNADTWAKIRHALRDLIADESRPQDPVWADTPWFWAWERFAETGDKTDFVTDPLLFECWLVAIEPDEDSIEANWRILRGTEAFKRADQADQDRIRGRVEPAA